MANPRFCSSYSIAQSADEDFINNIYLQNVYFTTILFIIIRDYPILELSVTRVHKVRSSTDAMAMRIKNNVITIKLFFSKFISNLFAICFTKQIRLLNAHIQLHILIFLLKEQKNKYMVVPFHKDVWGKLSQNRIILLYFQGDIIHQKIIDSIPGLRTQDTM